MVSNWWEPWPVTGLGCHVRAQAKGGWGGMVLPQLKVSGASKGPKSYKQL